MIVTDRFVFVHMHKTGGQTINRLITNHIANHTIVGYHYPIAEVPDDAAHLPVVGIVRNPWDWYVSWYAFNQRPGARNPLYHVVSENGSAGFRRTVTNLVELGSGKVRSATQRKQLQQILPDSLEGNRGAGITRSCMDELGASNVGYLSWLFERMLGGARGGRRHIGRFENLRSDLVSILDTLGVPQVEAIEAQFDTGKRENVSRHSHYSHYYDDELCDLIASHEKQLIDRYAFAFDSIKPATVSYELSAAGEHDGRQGFRKLLGRGDTFLRLNEALDVKALRRKVEKIPDRRWAESDRNRIFKVHSDTQSLALVHFEDFKFETPEYRDLYAEFRDDIEPVIEHIAGYYRDNGFVVRALLAKLAANGEIPRHSDAGYSLMNSHRVHLPVITNSGVEFHVGGETIHMQAGELWEINNATMHGVKNRGAEDRVHLIIDWMPNRRADPVDVVLRADDLDGPDRDKANDNMLASIVDQARQLQRAGQTARAEALYRQVLHFDPNHVVAGNLLGLLCLQTRRADEAVRYIERALANAPHDAQAHANLGLALKDSGRPEDAVRHMRESLDLAPGNARVLNNLGSLLLVLGRAEESIACFREALDREPGYAEVYFNLGNALMQLQRYEDALRNLEKFVAMRPEVAAGHQRLLEARASLGAGRRSH